MAFLHKAIEKKFGKKYYDKNDPEIQKIIKEFNRHAESLYGIAPDPIIINSNVSFINFEVGMQVKYKNDIAIVEQIIDISEVVVLKTREGEQVVLTGEDFDCFYFFDDFFTRPNDKLLTDYGFVKIFEEEKLPSKSNEKSKIKHLKEIWKYEGHHEITKLHDFWYCYVSVDTILYDQQKMSLPEYKMILFAGGRNQSFGYGLQQIGMEHIEYRFNKGIFDYKPLKITCENEDIIITDPVRLFGGPDYFKTLKVIGKRPGFSSIIPEETWTKKIIEKKTRKVFGEVNAETGKVCVYRLKDVYELLPKLNIDELTIVGYATVIKNFTGEVSLSFTSAEPKDISNGFGTVQLIGKGNVNFYSI